LNTTIWPPAVAGFGENDWAPFWLVMVMVRGAEAAGVEGVEGDETACAATRSDNDHAGNHAGALDRSHGPPFDPGAASAKRSPLNAEQRRCRAISQEFRR